MRLATDLRLGNGFHNPFLWVIQGRSLFRFRNSRLITAFVLLQFADVITTKTVIARGGWEVNPFEVYAMAHFGAWWPLAKLGPMLVAAALMVRWDVRAVGILVAIMGIVVLNNTFWAALQMSASL